MQKFPNLINDKSHFSSLIGFGFDFWREFLELADFLLQVGDLLVEFHSFGFQFNDLHFKFVIDLTQLRNHFTVTCRTEERIAGYLAADFKEVSAECILIQEITDCLHESVFLCFLPVVGHVT